uniref:Transposon Ty3-I Gag-Pol polyprotein n=1 Tax=Vitis vinifera TaxID=29760 RepID=A5AYM2_VITVI|nr:hypothetical protein VITISV_006968 [Vitis vinifera]
MIETNIVDVHANSWWLDTGATIHHGFGEFIAAVDHDTPFGLDFVHIEVDYRFMAQLRKERMRARLTNTPFDYPVSPYSMSLADYFVRALLRLSDGTPGTFASALAALSSPYCMSLMTLYFPDEVDEHGTFAEIGDKVDEVVPYDRYIDEMLAMNMSCIDGIVQPEFASSFDLFGVSAIVIVEEIQTTPILEFLKDDIVDDDVFVGVTSLVVLGYEHVDPPLSFDVLLGFVSLFDDKIQKQLNVGLLSMVEYPEWLANVVYVPKKNGNVRDCIDFRDLNKTSLNDDFPLPHIDMLVDSTVGHSMLSFMDEFFGYNRILMTPKDMEKTSFITKWDNMIEKYRDRVDHLAALERFFERIRRFRLRLNPKKCTFRVTSGKLLGYMVSERGIEADPDKSGAIIDMPAPRTEREIRGFLGRLQYIARLANIYEPIFRLLMKKYSVHLISHLDPLRYLFDRPTLIGQLMRWLVLLTKFDIHYVTQKSNRGSIVADHLASLPVSDGRAIDDDFLDEDIATVTSLSELDDDLPWYHDIYQFLRLDIYQFLRLDIYPEVATAKDKRALRQLATLFVICRETLYR